MSTDPCSTRVPDGSYRAAYVACEDGKPHGVPRWFVHFKITEPGEHFGLVLIRFYNVPRGAFLARTHNLWIDYQTLIGGRPPPQGLTPEAFLKGCEILVKTKTVKHRVEGRKRIELPEDCWYSKIDRLIRITAGSPPCMPGRAQRAQR
jgi:hypothetical protein